MDEALENIAENNDSTPENNDENQNYNDDFNVTDSNERQNERQDEEDSRFKDGETITLVRVRFPGNSKSFPFLVGKRKFQYGQKVMAMSDRGMTVGYINSFAYQVAFNKTMLPLRTIAREATAEDIRQQIEFHESEKKAEVICLRLIERYNLEMILTHVEFIQFGKKAVFYFNAPERVDFRNLVKDLVQELKMRIELRQISVRDRAAALGSIGACGLQTCCSSFLKNYGNVSIKMAKNQNLALIPSKLNGVCGQIKCCIKYEDDVYSDKRKNLPKEGSIIAAKNGDRGKVLRLHLLIEQFELLTDTGIKRRYASNQFDNESLELPVDYRFPETFDNIIDETKSVIGLTIEEELVSKRFKKLMDQDLSDSDDEDLDDEEENFDDENDDNLDFSDDNEEPEEIPHYREEKNNNSPMHSEQNRSNNQRNNSREQQSHHPRNNQEKRNHPRNNQERNNHPNNNRPRNNDQRNQGQKTDNRQRPQGGHNRRFNNQNQGQSRPQGQNTGSRPSNNQRKLPDNSGDKF